MCFPYTKKLLKAAATSLSAFILMARLAFLKRSKLELIVKSNRKAVTRTAQNT
jgi:hypothetical protein